MHSWGVIKNPTRKSSGEYNTALERELKYDSYTRYNIQWENDRISKRRQIMKTKRASKRETGSNCDRAEVMKYINESFVIKIYTY